MFNHLKARLSRFASDDEGTVAVDAIIVFPILLWLFGAIWVYFDVSRQQSTHQKANYTIGDMISRETDPLDDYYLDSAFKMYNVLSKSDATESSIRVSVIRWEGSLDNGEYELQWSQARGNKTALDQSDLTGMETHLPIMLDQDEIVLVETWEDYNPVFEAGLSAFEIQTYSFTRPRFAPKVLFLGEDSKNANNGHGNGDQDAPGNSLCNNNAENADEGAAADECAENSKGTNNHERGRKKKKRRS